MRFTLLAIIPFVVNSTSVEPEISPEVECVLAQRNSNFEEMYEDADQEQIELSKAFIEKHCACKDPDILTEMDNLHYSKQQNVHKWINLRDQITVKNPECIPFVNQVAKDALFRIVKDRKARQAVGRLFP
jgi:hypothetical protein